jgi:hypothetical protein
MNDIDILTYFIDFFLFLNSFNDTIIEFSNFFLLFLQIFLEILIKISNLWYF